MKIERWGVLVDLKFAIVTLAVILAMYTIVTSFKLAGHEKELQHLQNRLSEQQVKEAYRRPKGFDMEKTISEHLDEEFSGYSSRR